jgi:hypothetical protein
MKLSRTSKPFSLKALPPAVTGPFSSFMRLGSGTDDSEKCAAGPFFRFNGVTE